MFGGIASRVSGFSHFRCGVAYTPSQGFLTRSGLMQTLVFRPCKFPPGHIPMFDNTECRLLSAKVPTVKGGLDRFCSSRSQGERHQTPKAARP